MDQGANIIFISLFSGFNIAFAILSFFIWTSDKSQKLYLYFGIFSLFSGLYFLLIGLSVVFELEMHYAIIFCAAIYYGIFPWLIFELIENKQRTTSSILSFIFAFAFFVLLIYPDESDYALWQIIAHIGLLGLCLTTAYSSIIFKKRKLKGANSFVVLTIVFIFLALEEILSSAAGSRFLRNYFTSMAPLDIYPILFTSILGARLSVDFYSKNKVKIKLMQSELNEKQLKLTELEKLRLQQELQFKNKDLTSFGVEITKNRAFLKSIYTKLLTIEKSEKFDDENLREILKNIKSQLLAHHDYNHFNEHVEKVNHAFRAKLKKSYPSLTHNELHLASLLLLQLNTKEIAAIKNISPNSVKVLRYRLRQKLNLETSINLSEFLNSWVN